MGCRFSPHASEPISQTSLRAAMTSVVYLRGRPRFSRLAGSPNCIRRRRLIAPFLVSPDTATMARRSSPLRFLLALKYSALHPSNISCFVAMVMANTVPHLISTRGISVPFITSYKAPLDKIVGYMLAYVGHGSVWVGL